MRSLVQVCWLLAAVLTGAAPGASAPRLGKEQLLYHVETLDHRVLASAHADRPFNPASVVKVGTSVWALDRLGSGFRFVTKVGYRGVWDRQKGTVTGTLVVAGAGDPDFHRENAMLIARQLNQLGILSVSQGIEVQQPFTIGWERGTEGRSTSQTARHELMERRLLTTLDASRWDTATHECWRQLCDRRGFTVETPPSVTIATGVHRDKTEPLHPLLVHRSNPLWMTLKRFNVYSNNDIIRLADVLGGVGQLEAFLRTKLAATPKELQLTTASGELRNRMTPRCVVRLLRLFHQTVTHLDLTPSDLLPSPACDPGPVPRLFPLLSTDPRGRQLACKTGTLRHQDGGVAVLSGFFPSSSHGLVLFVVAATRAGDNLTGWRRTEQSWLLDLMTASDGVGAERCGQPMVYSDTWASVAVATEATAAQQPAAMTGGD